MELKILITGIMIVLITSSITVSGSIFVKNIGEELSVSNLLEGGYLEILDGVKVLHTNGSYYNMGYQHGYFLSEEIKQNLRAALNYAETFGIDETQLKNAWNITKNSMPQDILDEFQGMADGANVSFEELNYINLIPMLVHTDFPDQCTGFVMWGPATVDGELIQVASTDIKLDIEDPVTGKRPQENQIMIVRSPEGGFVSMYPAYAGYYGWNGINSQGIGICIQASWTDSTSYQGVPLKYRTQMAMDKASNVEEAIGIIRSNKTVGYNVIVSDAKIPVAYVIEMNADTTYIGTYDNPCESTKPFWQIDNVIRRSNFFISTSLSATQRSHYSPKSLFLMLVGQNNFYPFWLIYKSLSKNIEKNYGDIDIDISLQIMMETYTGESDVFISFVQNFGLVNKLAKKMGYLQALNQFATCPKTGDMIVTFADKDNPSCENPVHRFNLYELID